MNLFGQRSLALVFLSVSLLTAPACKGQGGSDASQPRGAPGQAARSAEEALSWMAESDRRQLEAWKNRISKECDATEAFPDPTSPSARIGGTLDLGLLLKATGNSLLVSDRDGKFAILGLPVPPSGTGHSRLSRSVSTNGGEPEHLEAEFIRRGSQCEVRIFGQKVHEARMVASVPVLGYYDPAREKRASLPNPAELIDTRDPAVGMLQDHGYDEVLSDALKDSQDAPAFLARRLGISESVAQLAFASDRSRALSFSATFPARSELLAFGGADPRLIGDASILRTIIRSSSAHDLVYRIQPSRLESGSVSNSADRGTWVLKFRIKSEVSSEPGSRPSIQHTVQSVRLGETLPFQDREAVACYLRRFEMLRRAEASRDPSWSIQPSYSSASGPCQPLSRDFEEALLSQPEGRRSIQEVFTAIRPSRQSAYNGWDQLLRDVVIQLGLREESIASQLDPNRRSQIITQVADLSETIAEELRALPGVKPLRGRFTEMTLSWSLLGETVPRPHLSRIIRAASNALDPFIDSTERLLDQLASAPHDLEANLQYALEIGGEHKSLGREIQNLALALEASDWNSAHLGRVIQERTGIESLRQWRAGLVASQAFARRDSARVTDRSRWSADRNRRELVSQALKEGWKGDQLFQDTELIARMARFKIMCRDYEDTSTLVNCAGLRLFSTSGGAFHDPKFQGRYAALSDDFVSYMSQIDEQKHPFLKDKLVRRFFEPVWARCSAPDFRAKADLLREQIQKLRTEENWSRRSQLEREIDKTLEDCR